MPVIVHGGDVSPFGTGGCRVRPLLTRAVIGNDRVELDDIALDPGAGLDIDLEARAVGWVQVLDGAGALGAETLGPDNIAYLPSGFSGTFTAGDAPARLLAARVPEAGRFDPDIDAMPDALRSIDWTREPVLQSEHDARLRVYMATPALAGTEAFKGEMITYPPGTAAPEHHHEGAEHFQYVISGRGTALLDGEAHSLSAGDVLYNYEREPHAFVNEGAEDFVFVEFFVPGPCETVWSPGAKLCAWLPTGVDSEGRKPVRDIAYHVHGQDSGI